MNILAVRGMIVSRISKREIKMKIAVVYNSVHHKNTLKVLNAMREEREMDLFTVAQAKDVDLSAYDVVGFASGIYMNKFDQSVLSFIGHASLKTGQKVFIVYTCGVPYRDYASKPRKILKEKNCMLLGTFCCRGFDTFGPFSKIGGIAKGHPSETDLRRAKYFICDIT